MRLQVLRAAAAAPAVIGDIARDDRGRLFSLQRAAGERQFKLYRRDTPDGADVLLVDVDALAKGAGRPHAIGTFVPAPDGRHVAYTLLVAGSEIGTLNVIDAATGKATLAPIDRVRGGGIAVAEWLIANGYTSRDRLAVMGGSAGGVFAGRSITERPDLFGAAVIAVGNVDSLRSETRANEPATSLSTAPSPGSTSSGRSSR